MLLPRRDVAVLLGACALLGAALIRPHPIIWLLARRFPDVLFFADTDEPLIALTIDDSPHSTLTPRILDVLAEHGARATFFVIGAHVAGNEAVLRRMVEDGHEVGNHLLTDAPSARLSPEAFAAQLRQTHDMLAPYGPVRWFRPGHGRFHRPMLAQLKAHGYRCALASAFAFEFHIPFAAYAARHLLLHARPGAVIVLHDGAANRERTVETLRRLLPELRGQGYRIVTLSELVERGAPAHARPEARWPHRFSARAAAALVPRIFPKFPKLPRFAAPRRGARSSVNTPTPAAGTAPA